MSEPTSEPTSEHVREVLRTAFGLESNDDLTMQHELLGEHLHNHWIEGPGPEIDIARWGCHPSWEMSWVGPGGGYEVLHVALATERIDALVVLAAERMEAIDQGIPELTALAVDLLMHGRARIFREGDA